MLDIVKPLRKVRERAPLVQCITNFVTVNDCANILLAAGASPTMAHDVREAAEAVGRAQALVCNLGATENVEAMILAGKQANRLGIPVALDPVAAGGTQLRRDSINALLREVQFSVIRGNASEIRYLAGQQTLGSGVDVSREDAFTKENFNSAVELVAGLARRLGSVIAVSGETDIVSDGSKTAAIHNGCATMARITGSGCMLTSLVGAFCAVQPEDCFAACCSAVTAMGLAGELAEEQRLKLGTGNASFRTYLIDAVFNMTEEQLMEGARYEIF